MDTSLSLLLQALLLECCYCLPLHQVSLYSMMVGYRAAVSRSHLASVITLSTTASAAITNFAHVEAPPSGDFDHEPSPQARACRGT